VVNYIKDKSGEAEYLEGVTDRQKVAGNAGVCLDGNHGDEDELFEEAKAIIVKAGKASTSMLQRRLSIGYGRAAKILDMLEEAGIIGPSNGSKPRDVMISQEQYEAMSGSRLAGIPIHDRAAASAPDNYLGEDEEDSGLVFKNGEGVEVEESEEAVEEEIKNDEAAPINGEAEENEEIGEEEEIKAEAELRLTPDEEDEAINDEDEILDKIREDKKVKSSTKAGKPASQSTSTKKKVPLEDDDEMFFAR